MTWQCNIHDWYSPADAQCYLQAASLFPKYNTERNIINLYKSSKVSGMSHIRASYNMPTVTMPVQTVLIFSNACRLKNTKVQSPKTVHLHSQQNHKCKCRYIPPRVILITHTIQWFIFCRLLLLLSNYQIIKKFNNAMYAEINFGTKNTVTISCCWFSSNEFKKSVKTQETKSQ